MSSKFLRMCELYMIFARDYIDCCDFSDEAKIELYNVESYGGTTGRMNGYAVGKKWLSVTVKMWREDIKSGYLFKHELYDDPKFPHWWLDSVLKGI